MYNCEGNYRLSGCNDAACTTGCTNVTLTSSLQTCSGVSISGFASVFSEKSCGPLIRDQGNGLVKD
jgi:hypothetical protein